MVLAERILPQAARRVFFGDVFSWLHQPEIEAFLKGSNLAAIAARVTNAQQIRLFYDQILLKEPGAVGRTPWHQDLPYWPVLGGHVISIWVALDTATCANGVVSYIRGSHRWNRVFPMQPFAEGGVVSADEMAGDIVMYDDKASGEWQSLPDIGDNLNRYKILSRDLQPASSCIILLLFTECQVTIPQPVAVVP